VNIKIYNTLPRTVSTTSGNYALIARLDGKEVWEFLLQPTELQWSHSSSYQPSGASGSIPILQFSSYSGWAVSMNFPLYGNDRNITNYVERLSSLLIPENGSPPVLFWQWGERSLSPCVMVKFDRTENNWTSSGQLLSCKIDLTLVQVNEKQLIP
jgi:hypothetical protein